MIPRGPFQTLPFYNSVLFHKLDFPWITANYLVVLLKLPTKLAIIWKQDANGWIASSYLQRSESWYMYKKVRRGKVSFTFFRASPWSQVMWQLRLPCKVSALFITNPMKAASWKQPKQLTQYLKGWKQHQTIGMHSSSCSEVVGIQKRNYAIRFSLNPLSDMGQQSHGLFTSQSLWKFHFQALKW